MSTRGDKVRKYVGRAIADIAGEREICLTKGGACVIGVVVKSPANAAMDVAVRYPEIILRPFPITFIHIGAIWCAGRTETRVEVVRVFRIGNRRVKVGTTAKPAFRFS